MKGNFHRFVQEGDLISLQFEQQPIRNVFAEILSLLSAQESRIDQISGQLPMFVLTSQIDAIRTEIEQIKQKIGVMESSTSKTISDTKEETSQKMTELKEYTDTAVAGIMIDVKRYLDSEVQDILNAERSNDQNSRDITELSRSMTEIQATVGLLSRDINTVRKDAAEKTTPNQVTEIVTRELNPLMQELKQLDSVNSDIASSRGHIRELGEQLEHLQKTPAPTPTETKTIPSIPHPSPPIPPTPQPSLPTEPAPVEVKRAPVIPEPDPQPKVIQLPIIPPPLEDNASVDRQLRRLNEVTNNFKFAIELLKDNTQQNIDKIRQLHQQMNLRNISTAQEMDQLHAQLDRLKEQQGSGAVELKSKIDEMKEDIEDLKNSVKDTMKSARDDRRRGVRPDLRYAERVLPPLPGPESDDTEITPTQSSRLCNSIASDIQARFEAQRMDDTEIYDDLCSPGDSGRRPRTRRDVQVKIIKQHAAIRSQESPPPEPATPSLTQEEIEEKVDKAIKMSIVGYLDRAKAETAKEIQNGLKVVDTIASKIDTKIDRDFVERMFNKFRVVVADLKEKIQQVQCTFMGWVTREELQEVLEKFVDQLADVNDTAVGSSKYKCLLCGKPRTHISGMIVGPGPSVDDFEIDDLDSVTDAAKKLVRPKTGISSAKMTKRIPRRTPPQPRDVVQLLTSDATRA